jgi:hypothetical protein
MEVLNAFAGRDNVPGEFMAEQRGRNQHPGVVSTAEHLNISTAREGGPDTHKQFTRTNGGHGHGLQANVLLPIQNGSAHGLRNRLR